MKSRRSRQGYRHRQPNGPAELNVTAVPDPDPAELGTLSKYTHEILKDGPRALIAAEHKAAKLAARFGVDFESKWFLKTPWLSAIERGDPDALHAFSRDGSAPERGHGPRLVRYALQWRPRYLAVLALTHSTIFAAKAAKIGVNLPRAHRRVDPDFDAQCNAAEEHAIDLLKDVTMKSAMEGEMEPVFWQGIQVGHIKKVDNRLRIEMLRALAPKTFKTPGGSRVSINNASGSQNIFALSSEDQDQLVQLRQDALQLIHDKRPHHPESLNLTPIPLNSQNLTP